MHFFIVLPSTIDGRKFGELLAGKLAAFHAIVGEIRGCASLLQASDKAITSSIRILGKSVDRKLLKRKLRKKSSEL